MRLLRLPVTEARHSAGHTSYTMRGIQGSPALGHASPALLNAIPRGGTLTRPAPQPNCTGNFAVGHVYFKVGHGRSGLSVGVTPTPK